VFSMVRFFCLSDPRSSALISGKLLLFRSSAEGEESFQEEAFANSSSSARLAYPSIFRLGMA
jgi:hypothetical protein